MADNRTILLGNERQRERVGRPQSVNDSAFGLAAMLNPYEGSVSQRPDGSGVFGGFRANNHQTDLAHNLLPGNHLCPERVGPGLRRAGGIPTFERTLNVVFPALNE
ncbi:hypothetical protein BREVUG8_110906 [Brevundimonas sp. G8]|nr:hypothetical protein BREVUG8_110906 [Brevundimonas sp. G8]